MNDDRQDLANTDAILRSTTPASAASSVAAVGRDTR
jgi:hypothetical protein